MAVSVSNTTVSVNTDTAGTANAATESTINNTEVFTITLTKPAQKNVIVFYNGDSHGAISYSFAVGGQINKSGAAKTGSVAQAATEYFVPDGSLVSATGTMVCTLTPNTGKRLLTDHACGMKVLVLPS